MIYHLNLCSLSEKMENLGHKNPRACLWAQHSESVKMVDREPKEDGSMQFDFGKNWIEFSKKTLSKEQVEQSRLDFKTLFAGIELKEKFFLDIGFGQGFSLLLAEESDAIIFGNDINPKCREALGATAVFFDTNIENIPIVIGSILDDKTIENIVKKIPGDTLFDIVHSWGVLHHTGNMEKAIRRAASMVKEDGYFVVAIYNKHFTSIVWRLIKWTYCKSPGFLQKLFIGIFYPLIWVAKLAVTGKNPVKQQRGMSFFYNVVDWVGGYPYEYASIKEMIILLDSLGFDCIKYVLPQVSTGCNEFVFKKRVANIC
jgi:2-polyprenyl-6-hydroxyphenyl methylase/3-demethylubiquinone-9 3-methyltransferase